MVALTFNGGGDEIGSKLDNARNPLPDIVPEDKIIEELVKIRELLEPKTTPPEPEKKGFWAEFMTL